MSVGNVIQLSIAAVQSEHTAAAAGRFAFLRIVQPVLENAQYRIQLKMNYISAGVWRSEREPNI
jgi:hypothetical protein